MAENPETAYERAIEKSGMECSYYACWNPVGWVEPHPATSIGGRDKRAPEGMTFVCDAHHTEGVGYPLEH